MPSHRIHRLVDKIFLGREFKDVHRDLDEPAKWLGKRHRILRHDPIYVFLRFAPDWERVASGLLHIAADMAERRLRYRKRGRRP